MYEKTKSNRVGNFTASAVLLASLGLAAIAGGVAFSDNASATSKKGGLSDMTDTDRYQLKQKGDRFVRLDRKTGELSVCKFTDENLVCRIAADERMAMEAEIDELIERIEQLEGRRGFRERRYGFRYDNGFLSDDEFETTLDRSETVIRRLFGVMKELGE